MTHQDFRSNTELVRHHFLKLLSDGLEHTSAEIIEYIYESTGGTGIDGRKLGHETVRGAVWYSLRYGIASYVQTRKGVFRTLPAFPEGQEPALTIKPDFIAGDSQTDNMEYVFETRRGALHVSLSAFFDTDDEAKAKGFRPYFIAENGLQVYTNGYLTSTIKGSEAKIAIVGNGKPEQPVFAQMDKRHLMSALIRLSDGEDAGFFHDELTVLGSLVYLSPETTVSDAVRDCQVA